MGRVLVVAEPNQERALLEQALHSAPHTVKSISPGDLHIRSARDWAPDVIIMDLVAEGPTLPLRIGMLRDPILAGVPFIVLGDNEDEARALGAHAFVRKPATGQLEDLLSVIAHFSALRFGLHA